MPQSYSPEELDRLMGTGSKPVASVAPSSNSKVSYSPEELDTNRPRLPTRLLPGELAPGYRRSPSEWLMDTATNEAPTIGATAGSLAGAGAWSIPLAAVGGAAGKAFQNYIRGDPLSQDVVKEGAIQGGIEGVTHGVGKLGRWALGAPGKWYERGLLKGANAEEASAARTVAPTGFARRIPISEAGAEQTGKEVQSLSDWIANSKRSATGTVDISPFAQTLKDKAAAQSAGSFPGTASKEITEMRNQLFRDPGTNLFRGRKLPIQDALARVEQDKAVQGTGSAIQQEVRQQAIDFLSKEIERQIPGLTEKQAALGTSEALHGAIKKAVANGKIDPFDYIGASFGKKGVRFYLKGSLIKDLATKPEIASQIAFLTAGKPAAKTAANVIRGGRAVIAEDAEQAKRNAMEENYSR